MYLVESLSRMYATRRGKAALPLALVLLHALIWTALPLLGANVNLHGDSYEAFVWGREWQLGYYKHPPFWAWITGLWFSFFPHKDWAFFLLSELNASLGLLGVWTLLGRFAKGPERMAGVMLLLLTSFYTFNALRFNANTMQLSLWPWTMYFFVLSIERKTWRSGAVFGAFAAFSLLSKYYAGLLLFSCFAASLVRKDRLKYYASPAPWTAFAVFMLLVSPHIHWLATNHFLPFTYVADQLGLSTDQAGFGKGGGWSFFFAFLVYLLLPAGVVVYHKLTQRRLHEPLPADALPHDKVFLYLLGLLPLALTLVFALLGYHIMPHYILPAFSLAPFLVFCWSRVDAKSVALSSIKIYAVFLALLFCTAPFVPRLCARPFKPIHQVAEIAFKKWDEFTAAPLRIVTGSVPYDDAIAFYAQGDVSSFPYFNFDYAPWITRQRIAEQGMLIVCLSSDAMCLERAKEFETASSKRFEQEVEPRWWKYVEPAVKFTFILVPPR